MRSIRQTFRRPQLMAPIIVFPTLLLAIQTGGAGGAVDLPGFPPVQSFLQFMLAGAMMQSLMLAGNSGGIALAVDIEMGFTDRLFAAPIPRFTIVLGRLAGTGGAGPLRLALVPRDRADLRRRDRGRRRRRADRDRRWSPRRRWRSAGSAPRSPCAPAAPASSRASSRWSSSSSSSPPPSSPQELMIEPAKTIAEYNPLSFIVEGVRDPIISGIDATELLEAVLAIAGIVVLGLVLSARALRHRLRVG